MSWNQQDSSIRNPNPHACIDLFQISLPEPHLSCFSSRQPNIYSDVRKEEKVNCGGKRTFTTEAVSVFSRLWLLFWKEKKKKKKLPRLYVIPLFFSGFTVERYISICHPFQREKFCSTSRAIKVIGMLVLISLLLHAIQGYFWIYTDNDCVPRPSVTVGGTASLWSVWSWITELLVFGLVPLAILFLNILVIKEARYLSRTEESRLCLRGGHKGSAATVTLLAVSFYLIFTTLPVTICYALFSTFPEGDAYLTDEAMYTDPTWQRHFNYISVRTIVQELGMSHYACNFFIYLATGKLFRRELKLLILGIFCKGKLELLRRKEHSEMSQSYRATNATACTFARMSVSSKKVENGEVAHLWWTCFLLLWMTFA